MHENDLQMRDIVATAAGRGARGSAVTADRIAAKRLLVLQRALVLACVNATVLDGLALADSDPGRPLLRTACVGLLVWAVNASAFVLVPRLATVHTGPRRWRRGPGRTVAVGLSAAGLVLLAADAPASGILFAALLTPAGMATLLDDWPGAAAALALVSGGLAVAVLEPGGPALSSAVSDAVPALCLIAGGLVPVKYALRTMQDSPSLVAGWRGDGARPRNPGPLPGQGPPPTSPVLEDVAELVRMGRSYRQIAAELDLTVHQAEYLTGKLRDRHGVASKKALRERLNEPLAPLGKAP